MNLDNVWVVSKEVATTTGSYDAAILYYVIGRQTVLDYRQAVVYKDALWYRMPDSMLLEGLKLQAVCESVHILNKELRTLWHTGYIDLAYVEEQEGQKYVRYVRILKHVQL